MTTPDPTPYLLPTDLRTAEDVLAWQADCVLAWVPEHSDGRMPAGSLVQLLAARLDRERRQACRRGYEAEIQQARYHKNMEREARARLKVRHSDNDKVCAEGDLFFRRAYVRRALAFRAAARLP